MNASVEIKLSDITMRREQAHNVYVSAMKHTTTDPMVLWDRYRDELRRIWHDELEILDRL